jgi:hypothetical protein
MRIVTNTKLATRNKSVANYSFFLTFLLLIGGFFFVNTNFTTADTEAGVNPIFLLLQALILPISFIFVLFSIRMTNLWVRPPRPEDVLPDALRGLSKKSILYNYFHIPARHLLFCPQGVYAITTRWHDGIYTVDGDKWTTKANPFARFFSILRMDGVSNPTREAQRNAEYAQKILAKYAPNITVKPLIVFINPKAEVTIVNSDIPILFTDSKKKPNLKDYMRDVYAAMPGADGKKNVLPFSDETVASFERETVPQSAT